MRSIKNNITTIQKALGSQQDGIIGSHTSDLLRYWIGQHTDAYINKLPYEAEFFGCKVMIGDPKKVLTFKGNRQYSTKNFSYCMSGSFTYPTCTTPISIMVNKGKVIQPYSCRHWSGYPETVLYCTKSGVLGKTLIDNAKDLPKDVLWAIGGGDINTFKPLEEGFCKFTHKGKAYDHSDVFRNTAHCGIGYDKLGRIVGVYHPECTMRAFQAKFKQMGLTGIFLDGGHVSSINAGDLTANVNTKQGSLIQFY